MSHDYSLFNAPGPGPMESWGTTPPLPLGTAEELKARLAEVLPGIAWTISGASSFGRLQETSRGLELQFAEEPDGSVRFLTVRRVTRAELESLCSYLDVVAVDQQTGKLLPTRARVEAALKEALMGGDITSAGTLLGEHPEYISQERICGASWLEEAVSFSTPEMVSLFIARGANVNAPSSDGFPAMHCAIDRKQTPSLRAPGDNAQSTVAIIKLLVAAGADINVRGINDWTPLQRAARANDLELVKLLVELGADVSLKTRIDAVESALDEAERSGRREVAGYLRSRVGSGQA